MTNSEAVDLHHRIPWRRLIAELIVVFIGVYSAFLLDGCREQMKQDQRRSSVLTALLNEVRQSIRGMDQIRQAYEELTASWLAAYENGEMPDIREFHFVFSSRSDVWQATLQSGVLELVDIEVILALSDQNAEMDFIQAQVEAYDRFVAEQIIPNVGLGKAEFYDLETKKLKRQYRWYARYLESIGNAIDIGRRSLADSEQLLVSITHD